MKISTIEHEICSRVGLCYPLVERHKLIERETRTRECGGRHSTTSPNARRKREDGVCTPSQTRDVNDKWRYCLARHNLTKREGEARVAAHPSNARREQVEVLPGTAQPLAERETQTMTNEKRMWLAHPHRKQYATESRTRLAHPHRTRYANERKMWVAHPHRTHYAKERDATGTPSSNALREREGRGWHTLIERDARTRGGRGRHTLIERANERRMSVAHPHRTRGGCRWHTLIEREENVGGTPSSNERRMLVAHPHRTRCPNERRMWLAHPHRTRHVNERW